MPWCNEGPATYQDGLRTGFDLALEHIVAQHVVWDKTEIPPEVLLNLLADSLRALKALNVSRIIDGSNDGRA